MKRRYARYTYFFKEHIKKFLLRTNMNFSSDIYVAVSGGADSMALLYIFKVLNEEGIGKKLYALHVNHGTRIQCADEELMIREYCQQIGVELKIKHLKLGKKKKSNFENSSRELRYHFFNEYLRSGDLLLTAHHLDDSFEWSLMQQLKSSKVSTSLGIPLKRGPIIRPFLCVTRAQIKKLIKVQNLPFMEDSSNRDLSFERNYIRHKVIRHLKKKYPQYLKHYAARQNSLATKLGLSLVSKNEAPNNTEKMKIIYSLKNDMILIHHPKFENIFLGELDLLTKSIEQLGNKKRGLLAKEVLKLKEAFLACKKGPMSFSGGVKAYIYRGAILLLSQKGLKDIDVIDKSFSEKINEKLEGFTSFANDKSLLYKELLKIFHEEFLVSSFLQISNKPLYRGLEGLKSPSKLLPRTSELLLEHGIWHQNIFRCLSLLNKLDSL